MSLSSLSVLALSAVLLVSGLPGAAPQEPEAETVADAPDTGRTQSLLEAAASGLQSIKALEARFTQVAPDGEITYGKMYLSRPGRLRFEYDEPTPMLIVANGGLVYVHDSELQTTDSYPVGTTPLRFLLSKELDLDAAQVVSIEESEHGLKIVLAAKDKDLQGFLALLFEPEVLTLTGWSFVDPQGQMTLVDLHDVEEKKRLPNSLFRAPDAGGMFLKDN